MPVQQKKNPGFFFYLSAAAFFCLNIASYRYCVGIPVALVALFFLRRNVDFAEETRCSVRMRVFCLLSALGVCVCCMRTFYFLRLLENPASRMREFVIAHGIMRSYTTAASGVAVIGATVGLYFAYVMLVFVCKRISAYITESGLLRLSRAEKITCMVLFVVFAVLIVAVYLKSDVFFPKHPEKVNDTVFSADCQLLIVRDNAFLKLNHFENDIRQPLFSVFASPFCAIPYLVSLALPFRWSLPLLTAIANLALLLFSTLILSRLLRLSVLESVLFIIASSLTFSHIAFSLFIEQYVVAVLYLFMLLYAYCERKRLDTFALYAATGTLTTSCVAAIFMAEPSPLKNPAAWAKRLLFLALGFVVLLLALCRADIFIGLSDLLDADKSLIRFAGAKTAVPFSLRLLQFLDSVPYYFVSPAAEIVFSPEAADAVGTVIPAHFSYEIAGVTKVSVPGIVILVLCGASTFLNRRNVLARFSAFWIVFCFLLTCVVGWGCGAQENSLFLYALYFGWAYSVLLFMLVQRAAEAFRAKWLVPAVSVITCAVLLWLNVPGVRSLIDFALAYYPL